MTAETTSDFLNPEEFTALWTEITLIQARKRNVLYRAKRYGRWFVLKSLSYDCQNLTDYRLLQEREFHIGFLLHHPNIVETYSIEDVLYVGRCIVIEYVDGTTLGQWLATRPTYAAKLRLWNQLKDVRDYMESMQLEHHDLKLDNILVTRDGKYLKLIDFGLCVTDDSMADAKQMSHLFRLFFPNVLQRFWMRCSKWIGRISVVCLLLSLMCVGFFLVRHEQKSASMQQEQALADVNARLDAYFASWDKALEETGANTFFEVYEILNPLIHDSWRTRDSFMSLYPQNDPLHYAVFDVWTQCSLEKTNEINERYNLLEKD